MAKDHYLPRADKDRVVWLNNFSTKFGTSAVPLGFVAADVTSVNNDGALFNYLVNQVEVFTSAKENRVNYKNLIKDGPLGAVAGPAPTVPVVPAAPTGVAAGIFPRIAQLVQRIKNSPTYTEALGKDLGIIGAEQTTHKTEMKPVLKLVLKGGQIEVQWVKGDADAIHLETDKSNGKWELLAVDTVPHYTDTTPITTPSTWKYRAIYVINDEMVGQWSDVTSIAVG